ncbi:heme chaperone HemW isoform X2 [Phoenix dactylifera]|nr:heme chaperone HemW isoform X2 [Phoenix dactylifera]
MLFHSPLLKKARNLIPVPGFPNALPRTPSVCKFSSSADIPTPPPPTSAYVHLPFCRKRCHYCDFPIIALGSSSSSSSPSSSHHRDDDPRIANYIHLLLREIEATRPACDSQPPLETVFFGGGTPSLVPPTLVASVLDALRSKFGTCTDPEISIEMDPGSFDRGRMEELLELGVNRVSLGVQAFQEELLRACGRAHGLKEVYEAIEIVTGCDGLENWSMDLISSLPHQTPEMWEESLSQAVDARPTHVSVYDLQLEQGTNFGRLYTPGEFPLPTEAQSANFYQMASETLAKEGYSHYEISSYCKNGYECKHNLTYWQSRSFYGFGLGSASYINGVRFSRPRRLKEYVDWVQKLQDGMVDRDATRVGSKDMAMDVVMLSLRTARGLDMSSFGRSFGNCLALSLCRTFRPFVESGHVVAMDGDRKSLSYHDFEQQLNDDYEIGNKVAFIRLSDPDGFLLSNELISIAFGVISP